MLRDLRQGETGPPWGHTLSTQQVEISSHKKFFGVGLLGVDGTSSLTFMIPLTFCGDRPMNGRQLLPSVQPGMLHVYAVVDPVQSATLVRSGGLARSGGGSCCERVQ
jgi:hypothetical protein